jgi:hypothetical protein
MRTWLLGVFAVVCVALSAAAGPRAARAGSDPPVAAALARQVGPHCFPGVTGFPNPFLSTYVHSSTGVARTQGMEVGLFSLDDPPRLLASRQVDLTYLTQEFEFQQRVRNAVAVRLALSGTGRLGTQTAALLTEGVSVIMGWAAGGTLRLSERPGFLLSGSLDVTGNSLTVVSPRTFVEDVLANGLSDTTNSLAEGYANVRVTTGLRAAWGRSATTGYMLFGDVGFQDPYGPREPTEAYWQVGGAWSLDMRERWRPDLGFLASAAFRSSSSRNEDLGGGGWTAGLGIFYTGRPELTVGVQTLYTRLRQTKVDNEFGALGLNFVLRYDFS